MGSLGVLFGANNDLNDSGYCLKDGLKEVVSSRELFFAQAAKPYGLKGYSGGFGRMLGAFEIHIDERRGVGGSQIYQYAGGNWDWRMYGDTRVYLYSASCAEPLLCWVAA